MWATGYRRRPRSSRGRLRPAPAKLLRLARRSAVTCSLPDVHPLVEHALLLRLALGRLEPIPDFGPPRLGVVLREEGVGRGKLLRPQVGTAQVGLSKACAVH